MSGGHFDYEQSYIKYIANSIEDYLEGHELDDDKVEEILRDRWIEPDEKEYVKTHRRSMPNRYEYSEETLAEFRKGVQLLRKAYIYAQRIDWLLSDDDGEDTFHERLKEELDELEPSSTT